ncbi:MAG: thiamine pyrophosphate-binding protein [Hyphomicrobiaceae bacterium]
MTFTVADLIAEFLDRMDIETAFGIVSVHNIPMLDAISRRNRMRVVTPRGEAGAAHMADGYARATGKLGLLITSTGPGAANAVGGLVEAQFASTPVLHLTGQTLTKFVDRGMGTIHDIPDQLGLMRAAGKASFRIRNAQDALGVLRQAVAAAWSHPRGPVTVEVPLDIQREAIERPQALDTVGLPHLRPPEPSEAEMAALTDLLLSARRPMLWLGRGASQAGDAARALLDMGLGMVTSIAGRGVVSEDHPMSLGPLTGSGLPMVEAFYETVDLMIVAGGRVRGHETVDFSVSLPKRLVRIDINPRADGRTYPNIGFVLGDAAEVLGGLAERVRGRLSIDPAFAGELAALKTQARAALAATMGPYASFADQLRAVTPNDAIWARDITINNSTWGNKLFKLDDPSANIYPIGAGIGQGFPLGIGAALSPGRRKTVVMTGDGGFYLSLAELWTAIQENLDMTILVMNDQGYGVIRHIQDKAVGGRRRFDRISGPDLEGLAKLAGMPYWRVSAPHEFGPKAQEAIAVRGLALVEVDMTAIGDHPPYYPYGPKAEVVKV